MDPLFHLVAASLAFLVLHVLPSSPVRPMLVGMLGERAYSGLFSLVSAAGIVWMVIAYNGAGATPLWPGLKFLPVLLVPLALVFIVAGVMSPNPTLVGQGRLLREADAAKGILRITRHPVMWGILLWAAAHLLARATLEGIVFFGTFVVLAAAGTLLLDARKAARYGEDWKRFAASTSNLPFLAIAQGRNRFALREIGFAKVAIGLAVSGGVFLFHGMLFGLRPF